MTVPEVLAAATRALELARRTVVLLSRFRERLEVSIGSPLDVEITSIREGWAALIDPFQALIADVQKKRKARNP